MTCWWMGRCVITSGFHENFKARYEKYPVLRITILHTTAPREAMFAKAAVSEAGVKQSGEVYEDHSLG